ncbi:MAG TPA: SCO family protein [Pyrinomonadaceae bacterium]|nr:SCO family protein [Pyrinomonadaceae bacterium]
MRSNRVSFKRRSVAWRRCLWVCVVLLVAHCSLLTARGQYGRPPESSMPQGGTPDVLKSVNIEQRLNEQVPLDLRFRDETGRTVELGEYFKDGKPVVLSLVYYECPMLCNQVLNGLVGTLEALRLDVGKEFHVVTVSFDARETPELAAKKKETYLRRYGRKGADVGWHFLTGDKASIDRLTQAVGFGYRWDENSKQFAHASAIMVLTPGGRLSHYFYGIEYAPKEVRLALVEASAGRIGSPVDKLILYCYHYDPVTGRYGPVIMNIMRVAGVLTVFGVLGLLLALRRRGAGGGGGAGGRVKESVNVGGTA